MVEVDSHELPLIKLRVKASQLADVGKNIARIPYRYLHEIDIAEGELIEIIGENGNTTAVVALKASPEDEALDYIRMDGDIRENAGVSIDDYVMVRKTIATIAQKVEMIPTGQHHLRGAETYLIRELRGKPLSLNDKIHIRAGNRVIEYTISKLQPELSSVLIGENTELRINTSKRKEDKSKETASGDQSQRMTYEDIGGLKEKISMIREMVELPIRFPELFTKLGITPPKGLLLYGPPGTGKTLLARAVATESKANFMFISGPDILSKYAGESEKKLREIFEEGKKKAPSIIFIDEIDSTAPKRENASEASSQIVAQLLALMDGIEGRGEVIVFGATNLPISIDPALRRPGRFDREIEIGVPNKSARYEILMIHTRNMPLDENVNIDKLAEMTYGFVGADIASLAREAAFRSIRRVLPVIDWESKSIPAEILQSLHVTMQDFLSALFSMKPSAMREVFVEIPDVGWADIGGLDEIKQTLMETVVWPIKYPEIYNHVGTKPRGLMLFGPPGSGKTLLIRALAHESKFNLILIKGSELLSKWVGESEHAVRETFRKAKQVSPCIIFFDELDALTPLRKGKDSDTGVMERVVSTLMTEIDSLEDLSDVFIVAATNRPESVDPALIRPGRFDRLVYASLPNYEDRIEILRILTNKMPLSPNVNLSEIGNLTSGASGGDLQMICKSAAIQAIRKFMKVRVIPDDKTKTFLDTNTDIDPHIIHELLSQYPLSIDHEEFLKAIAIVGFTNPSDPLVLASEQFALHRGLINRSENIHISSTRL